MDSSMVTAFAALAGATIGGLTSLLASWLSQQSQAKAQRLAQDQLRRQEIYKQFIREAAKLYIHALQSDKANVFALMELYAEVSSMRVLSSPSGIDRADEIVKKIINEYLEPNKTFTELREMANNGLIDPLRNFSEACRAEVQVSLVSACLESLIVASSAARFSGRIEPAPTFEARENAKTSNLCLSRNCRIEPETV